MKPVKRLFFILFLVIFFTGNLNSQSFKVLCHHKPLNTLLVELRDDYALEFSYDDQALANYPITINQQFFAINDLMDSLLKGLPLKWERINGVIVIYPFQQPKQVTAYMLLCRIREAGSGEPLAFTHVLVNGHNRVTDLNGAFSFQSATDSIFRVKASHLGCHLIDTVLIRGNSHQLYMRPLSKNLPEVIVRDDLLQRSVQMGKDAGSLKLNAYISQYLPGNGDNSVFNLLRLQPGILAAGEQPNDIIIWGSYEGTSRVTFDGFTIWGLKNFNDNISAVNPFLAKDVTVLKGGYDASSNDVVGGLVEITGKVGSNRRTGLNLFVNNQTLNGMMEVPLSQKISVLAAYRQTYYNVFDESDLLRGDPEDYQYKIEVIPDYRFRDANFKMSWQGDNGDLFYISALGAHDRFFYSSLQKREFVQVSQSTREENRQWGGAAVYHKNWRNGSLSKMKLNYSALLSGYALFRGLQSNWLNRELLLVDEQTQNDVKEFSASLTTDFKLSPTHALELGLESVQNNLAVQEDTFEVAYAHWWQSGWIHTLFLNDRIALLPNFQIKPGLRISYVGSTSQPYLSPRMGLVLSLTDRLTMNGAWGLYHQYLVKTSVMDESGNYRYSWSLADGSKIPVLTSFHTTASIAYTKNGWNASVEGYSKRVARLTRYIRSLRRGERIFEGEGRSYGLDFFLKRDFNRHTLWISYSVSRSEELFPYFPEKDYRRAPQDQTHEIKTSSVFHWKRFHGSVSYVFGSGFPLYANYISSNYTEPDYSRLDLSLVYRFSDKKVNAEAGFSILNVLNASNVKFTSFERIPTGQLNTAYIDAEAVGFTPLLFLKISF